MQPTYEFLLTLGGILLLGLFTSAIGRYTFLPRVTLLLLFGMLIGRQFFDLIPEIFAQRFELIANMALLMVGFLLGGKLTFSSLRTSGTQILSISISAAVVTTLCVTLALILLGLSIEIAVLLGCIAAATAPAAILDVSMESEQQHPFKNKLLSIVAIDDAWALLLFALGMALVSTLNGNSDYTSTLLHAVKDIGGAVLLGTLIGFPASYLTGRVKSGQPVLTEALGLVFICGGLALWLDVSFLIAAMVMGAIVANFARHHEYPFHAIEGIEQPLMVIFFVLAGASLELDALLDVGLIGIVYITARTCGKILGARIGSQCCHADVVTKKWMGLALLPQAGVAIGMGLVAANAFPEYRQILLTIVISSTVFFELVGPIFTRLAINKAVNAMDR